MLVAFLAVQETLAARARKGGMYGGAAWCKTRAADDVDKLGFLISTTV